MAADNGKVWLVTGCSTGFGREIALCALEQGERVVVTAPQAEPVREAEEVRLVDGVQHLHRSDPERPLPPVGFGDVHSASRLRSIRSALQPIRQVLEIGLQRLIVVPPPLPIHTEGGFPLQREVGRAQYVRIVSVVQECREPRLPILSGSLTYPRVHWARSFGAVSEARFALAGSLWSSPFPPSPPLPVARPCSRSSRGTTGLPLWSFIIGVRPRTSRHDPCVQPQDLTVPVHGISVRARGLCPRGAQRRLAISTPLVWPSDISDCVGTPDEVTFATQYPARTSPWSTLRQRLYGRLRMTESWRGSLNLHRMILSFTTPCRF